VNIAFRLSFILRKSILLWSFNKKAENQFPELLINY
jgi:hypothetical protein